MCRKQVGLMISLSSAQFNWNHWEFKIYQMMCDNIPFEVGLYANVIDDHWPFSFVFNASSSFYYFLIYIYIFFFHTVSLENITRLTLTHNRLTMIPPAIANLINLEILNLFDNIIEELPTSISSLNKLRILNVGWVDYSLLIAKCWTNWLHPKLGSFWLPLSVITAYLVLFCSYVQRLAVKNNSLHASYTTLCSVELDVLSIIIFLCNFVSFRNTSNCLFDM